VTTTARKSPGSGLVVVDKPGGITSHDVVARVRRLAGTRKVGHAGTLDPMATGVLVLGVNQATRLLGHLIASEKGYDATVRLGASTSTDDAEGTVTSSTPAGRVTEADVRAAVQRFVGEVDQVPSSVSAIKVDGQRAYARVRAGEQVVLAARRVSIESLEVTGARREENVLDVDISVQCSSGTYIRAIARDLGSVLGVGGHLTMLRRTSVAGFHQSEARPLAELEGSPTLPMIGLGVAARRCFPARLVDQDAARDISFGRKLELDLGAAGPVAVFGASEEFLALYEQHGSFAVPVAVFPGST